MSGKSEKRRSSLAQFLFTTPSSVFIPFGTWDDEYRDGFFRGPIHVSQVFWPILIVMAAASVFRLLFHNLDNVTAWLIRHTPSPGLRAATGMLFVGVSGYLLWTLRSRRRLLYSLVELGCAGAVAWAAMDRIVVHERGGWVALMTAAYLVVRGLDNWNEGWKGLFPPPAPAEMETGR